MEQRQTAADTSGMADNAARANTVLVAQDDDLADIERRLEAWLLIARFITPRRA